MGSLEAKTLKCHLFQRDIIFHRFVFSVSLSDYMTEGPSIFQERQRSHKKLYKNCFPKEIIGLEMPERRQALFLSLVVSPMAFGHMSSKRQPSCSKQACFTKMIQKNAIS